MPLSYFYDLPHERSGDGTDRDREIMTISEIDDDSVRFLLRSHALHARGLSREAMAF